jgi:small subunit ribosomal protein S1
MSWSTHLRSAQDFVKVGDVVEAVILDRDDRKMSLGIKQLSQDPWTDITSKYPVGSFLVSLETLQTLESS